MIPFSQQMARWGGIAGRPITAFEQMMIRRAFVYDHYWKTWNRIIKPVMSGHPYGIIEMNLTPIPHVGSSTWNSHVEPMRLRLHNTHYSKEDDFATELPTDVKAQLIDHVGHENAMFMLTADIWPLIEVDRLIARKRVGGVPLALCRAVGTEGLPT